MSEKSDFDQSEKTDSDPQTAVGEQHPTRDTRTLAQVIADGNAFFGVGAGAAGHRGPESTPSVSAPPPMTSPERNERKGPPENRTIPPAFRWATLDADDLRQRVQRARAIDEGRTAAMAARSLLLSGPSGSGKTSLACALLRAWDAAHRRPRGVFMPAWRLGVARAQYGLGQGEAPEVERAMTTRLLLLDDLGSERNIATNAVPDVIFARALAGLPTWVTTWMTAAAVAQRYGDGVARRLHEAGQVTAIVCGDARG